MSIEILEIQGTKASSLLPLNFSFEFEAYLATKSRFTRVGLIVSRNYRMVMYRDFQNIEEYMSHSQMLGKFEYGLPAKF